MLKFLLRIQDDGHFQLGQWLKRIKAEVEAPDLWAAIGEGRLLSDAASSVLETDHSRQESNHRSKQRWTN